MTFRKLAIIGLIISAMVLPGCVKREIVMNPQDIVPDVIIKNDIEINWEQTMEDCESLLSAENYPKGLYLNFATHEATDDEPAYTEIIWPVSDDITEEEAVEYAKAYAKAFNDAMATQDFSYALSTDDSYGGYWDKNNMYVQVFRESDILSPEKYIVNQLVEAGTNADIITASQAAAQSQN